MFFSACEIGGCSDNGNTSIIVTIIIASILVALLLSFVVYKIINAIKAKKNK